MSSNYLDPSRPIDEDCFYIVVMQKQGGEMYVIQNISASPREQRFLRTKEEADIWKSFQEKNFPNDVAHILPISANPTLEMMWPEGFEDRIDFAKKLNKL